MKVNSESPMYPALLATYLNTKEGMAFALSIMSQLIDGFETDHKGRIKDVAINDTKNIVLEFE